MGKFVEKKEKFSFWRFLLTALLTIPAIWFCGNVLVWSLTHVGVPANTVQGSAVELGIMDRFNMKMTNQISSALEGVLSIEKVYWLSDDDQVAPEPNADNYGTTKDPASMQEFLDKAKEMLGVEDTLFSTDVKLMAGSEITYYLDETIMVITWKQVIHGAAYTMSEVKIAHPSQFRRFLADGTYGSDKQYQTTQMAATVNAVTASSGDFYKFRSYGIIVYNGEVMRANSEVDTCFINEDGDLLFSYRGEIKDMAAAQKYVEENNVRFSLAFGPVLVENYQKVTTNSYPCGEINKKYSRAAIAQMGELHYLLVACNHENGNTGVTTISGFADTLVSFGVERAYSLDGGQTAAIVTGDRLISRPDWGTQRLISDIVYFATAVPDGG